MRFRIHGLAALLLSTATLSAPQAATVELGFTGTLTLNPISTTNFFQAQAGESVSGRFLFDTEVPLRNISPTPATTLHYNAGARPDAELSFISTRFDLNQFDFSHQANEGRDRDSFRIGPMASNQSLSFSDLYGSGGGSCGTAGGPDYCWGIQLALLKTAGTFALQWPQTLQMGADQLKDDELRFILYNNRADLGPTGLMSGRLNLTSLNLQPPAPVPLPASAWLLLTGLAGWQVIKARRRRA